MKLHFDQLIFLVNNPGLPEVPKSNKGEAINGCDSEALM